MKRYKVTLNPVEVNTKNGEIISDIAEVKFYLLPEHDKAVVEGSVCYGVKAKIEELKDGE